MSDKNVVKFKSVSFTSYCEVLMMPMMLMAQGEFMIGIVMAIVLIVVLNVNNYAQNYKEQQRVKKEKKKEKKLIKYITSVGHYDVQFKDLVVDFDYLSQNVTKPTCTKIVQVIEDKLNYIKLLPSNIEVKLYLPNVKVLGSVVGLYYCVKEIDMIDENITYVSDNGSNHIRKFRELDTTFSYEGILSSLIWVAPQFMTMITHLSVYCTNEYNFIDFYAATFCNSVYLPKGVKLEEKANDIEFTIPSLLANKFIKNFIRVKMHKIDEITSHKKYAVVKLIKQKIDDLVKNEFKFIPDTIDESYNKAISKVMLQNFLEKPESCIKITLDELVEIGYIFKEQQL